MNSKTSAIYNTTVIAMSVAFITVCSWITIPFSINFTLQLFAVFFISGCFPPTVAISSIFLYIILGLVGAPIFSGFNSGLSALLSASGGFIISFIFSSIIISCFRKYYTKNLLAYIATMIISLILCYTIGCLWYMYVFCSPAHASLSSAIAICVLPFIIIDVLKILLSAIMLKKLKPYIDKLPL